MSPCHHPLHHPPRMRQRIERALFQLHLLLRLIERGATQTEIECADAAYRRSLQKIDVCERQLLRHYPKLRLAVLGREAAASACMQGVVEPQIEGLN